MTDGDLVLEKSVCLLCGYTTVRTSRERVTCPGCKKPMTYVGKVTISREQLYQMIEAHR